jgi:hypothetical protein
LRLSSAYSSGFFRIVADADRAAGGQGASAVCAFFALWQPTTLPGAVGHLSAAFALPTRRRWA